MLLLILFAHSSLTLWPLFSGCWEGPPPPLDPWSTANPPDETSVFSSVSHPSCFCFFFFSSLAAKTKNTWGLNQQFKGYIKYSPLHPLPQLFFLNQPNVSTLPVTELTRLSLLNLFTFSAWQSCVSSPVSLRQPEEKWTNKHRYKVLCLYDFTQMKLLWPNMVFNYLSGHFLFETRILSAPENEETVSWSTIHRHVQR